jgi:hypothetical protein
MIIQRIFPDVKPYMTTAFTGKNEDGAGGKSGRAQRGAVIGP